MHTNCWYVFSEAKEKVGGSSRASRRRKERKILIKDGIRKGSTGLLAGWACQDDAFSNYRKVVIILNALYLKSFKTTFVSIQKFA